MDPRTLSLYLIADVDGGYNDPIGRVLAACSGGAVTMVQLRSKTLSARAQVDLTRELARALAVPVVVNDRADVAVAAGASGVHVGQSDLHPEDVHTVMGPDALVGLTVRSIREARDAPLASLDYVSVGGVFATTTKRDAADPIGLHGLAEIVGVLRERDSAMPICAIAGMSAARAADVMNAGVDGICVASAVLGADDPAQAAAEIAEAASAA